MGGIIINGKKVKSLKIENKNVDSFIIEGKKFTFKDIGNTFKGKFNSKQLEKDFLAITNDVPSDKFKANKLTYISMPDVESIGGQAFFDNLLKKIDLPKIKNIYGNAFNYNKLTSLDLPNLISASTAAFANNELTSINIPNVTGIGYLAFTGNKIKKATMKKKFDTNAEKDKIFGAGAWKNITFTWV